MTKARYTAFLIALCMGSSAVHPTYPAEPPVRASVADVAWLTGFWTGPFGEGTLEETWTAPNECISQASRCQLLATMCT